MGADHHNQNNAPDPSISHNAPFTMPINKGKQRQTTQRERLKIIGLKAKGFFQVRLATRQVVQSPNMVRTELSKCGRMSGELKITEDGNSAHLSSYNVTDKKRAGLDIMKLPWPARSPDLKPVENM